jgi:hypothetical protein
MRLNYSIVSIATVAMLLFMACGSSAEKVQKAQDNLEKEKADYEQAKLDSINGLLDMDKEAKDALEEIEDSKPIIPLKPIKDDNKKPVSTPKDSMTLVKKEEED